MAVNASISTPVFPIVFTVVWQRIRLNSSSGVRSISTWVKAIGWHNGISSDVFLQAMMPATRAMASTSPFLCPISTTCFNVFVCIEIYPSVTAMRWVSALSLISTIWASPASLKCGVWVIAKSDSFLLEFKITWALGLLCGFGIIGVNQSKIFCKFGRASWTF